MIPLSDAAHGSQGIASVLALAPLPFRGGLGEGWGRGRSNDTTLNGIVITQWWYQSFGLARPSMTSTCGNFKSSCGLRSSLLERLPPPITTSFVRMTALSI